MSFNQDLDDLLKFYFLVIWFDRLFKYRDYPLKVVSEGVAIVWSLVSAFVSRIFLIPFYFWNQELSNYKFSTHLFGEVKYQNIM
jgi:hypothetical protein